MSTDVMSLHLSDFDISPERGFLPHPDPLIQLPYHYVFFPLEKLANDLPKLLAAGMVRKEVKIFSRDILVLYGNQAAVIINAFVKDNQAVLRRLKLLFDYVGQAYVWGEANPPASIPFGFAEFWCKVSEKAGLYSVLSYAPWTLYNWQRFDREQPIALGNIAMLQNFFGGLDENWFGMVHVDIEARAGMIPQAIIEGLQAVWQRNDEGIEAFLIKIAHSLHIMHKTLLRMPEYCDPYIYYQRVRPFLFGWKNNPATPHGMIYDGAYQYMNVPQYFRGESGAQSAIVPSLVAALGIIHTQTDFTPYLEEMRSYMPIEHRKFVETIEWFSRQGCSIRDFVVAQKHTHPSLYDLYRECRNLLAIFREKHFEYAARYIQQQVQRNTGNSTEIGTAGTPFMASLAQLIKETRL